MAEDGKIGADWAKNMVELGRQEVANVVENKPIDTPAPEANSWTQAVQEARETAPVVEQDQERSR